MAVKVQKEPTAPKSTSKITAPAAAVTTTAIADNASTNAVPHQPPGTTVVDVDQTPAVVTKPVGPVTTTVSWLSETKPVEPPKPVNDPKVETK